MSSPAWVFEGIRVVTRQSTDESETLVLNLNMLLYVILFFIILGLFLASLVRSRAGTRRSGEDKGK